MKPIARVSLLALLCSACGPSAWALPNGNIDTTAFAPMPSCDLNTPAGALRAPAFTLPRGCVLYTTESLITSSAQWESAVRCEGNEEPVPAIDFTRESIAVFRFTSEMPQSDLTLMEQGNTLTYRTYQVHSSCGGTPRNISTVESLVRVPAREGRRVRTVVCATPAPDCSGPPRP